MLKNIKNNCTTPFIDAQKFIEYSDFEFYMTGSRYFNQHKPDSDFDYFCEVSGILMSRLENLGFTRVGNYMDYQTGAPYRGNSVLYVYRFHRINTGEQTDIQMCDERAFKEKIIIHRLMMNFPALVHDLYSTENKTERSNWWTDMHRLLRGQEINRAELPVPYPS